MSFQGEIQADGRLKTAFRGGLAEGTNLRTPCGLRRIELIRPGDLIVTRSDGLLPVRLVWQREVSGPDMVQDISLAPVRLKPRAIGPGAPQSELLLAPDHRVLVPGFKIEGQARDKPGLVRAQELAGTCAEIQTVCGLQTMRYFQLVFDRHVVLAANGLPVESFLANPAAIAALSDEMRTALVNQFPLLRQQPNGYPLTGYPITRRIRYLPYAD